jgi:hypothetical protein
VVSEPSDRYLAAGQPGSANRLAALHNHLI